MPRLEEGETERTRGPIAITVVHTAYTDIQNELERERTPTVWTPRPRPARAAGAALERVNPAARLRLVLSLHLTGLLQESSALLNTRATGTLHGALARSQTLDYTMDCTTGLLLTTISPDAL